MELGRFHIEQLSEGQFEFFSDGTVHRKPVDESADPRPSLSGKRNSALIGINPILISNGEDNILLDTGLGWGLDAGSGYDDISNVVTNLDIFDIDPEAVSHVVLTHLHYDHAAGSSFTDASSATRPTFPNATYYVQKREWDYALEQVESGMDIKGIGYRLDDFYRLVADGRVEFITEDFMTLTEGVEVMWTGGHTPGHQAVRIRDQGKTAFYLGELLPNESHLNRYAMRQMDVHPLQAKKMKIQLLKSAYESKAVLFFYHSLFSKVGRLEKDQKRYVLKELN